MGPGLVIAFTLCLVSFSNGLNFSFDLRGPSPSGSRSPCGVLSCVESYVSSDSSPDQNHTTTGSSSRTITGMNIFTVRSTSPNSGDGKTRQLLASLTLQQPNITRVSNGMKIEGHLEASEATLLLEIFKVNDCSAEFVCEVVSQDAQGNQVMSSNLLRQQQTQGGEQTGSRMVFSRDSSQFMMLVQQLAQLENRLDDRMESRLAQLENRLEDRMESRLAQLENRLEDRMESRLAQLENHLEDRIRSIEDKIESRVTDKLEAKLSEHNFGNKLAVGNDNVPYESFVNEQQESLKNAVAISERIERNLNTSFMLVERHLNQLQALGTTDLMGPSNVSERVHELLSNVSKCSDHQVTCPDVSLQESFLREIQGLKLNTCNSSTEMLSSLHHQISETNSLISNNCNPASDLFMPKRCKRGPASLPVQTPFPYPVIRPNKESVLNVPYLCDEITDGGGWIVIQRRTSGDVDFYRDWATYKKGFGSLDTEFWLGNDNLHALTSSGNYELRVDLKYNGKSAFAHYGTFSVDGEENNYALRVGGYTGTAGDELKYHNGMAFSTFDDDNDKDPRNCAIQYTGAWWYYGCHHSNLNGKWGAGDRKGPAWYALSRYDPVSFSEMKIRAADTS